MFSIIRHTIGIACELLTIPDPFDTPIMTKVTGSHVDECGRTVLEVQAGSSRAVSTITAGTTPPGNLIEVHTRVGPFKWEVHLEER